MPDPTSVSNGALGELGANLITDFDEETSLALLCRTHFEDARDATLELHPFNFAGYRASLVRQPADVDGDWLYQYLLPAGPTPPYCIKVRGIINDRARNTFEIGMNLHQERILLCDFETVSISYTGRTTNLNAWSPLAIQVLIKVLASKLAKPVTGQNSTERLKLEEAMALLPESRASDGREGSPVVLRANTTLTRARHRWGGRILEGLVPGDSVEAE